MLKVCEELLAPSDYFIMEQRRHSGFAYPDTRPGYHVKGAMKNKENREYANGFCGKLCMIFTVVRLRCRGREMRKRTNRLCFAEGDS